MLAITPLFGVSPWVHAAKPDSNVTPVPLSDLCGTSCFFTAEASPGTAATLTWSDFDGTGFSVFGYDLYYGPPGQPGSNPNRIKTGARSPAIDALDGYLSRCDLSNYYVRAFTNGRKKYSEALQSTGANQCGGGGGGSGGSSAVVAATTPEIGTVLDDVVTVPTAAERCPGPAADYPSWTVQWEEGFNVGSIQELSGRWATAQPWGSSVIVNGESQYYVDKLGVDANSDWTPFLFVQNSTGAERTDGAYLVIRAAPYVDSETGELASRIQPVAKHASGILTTRGTVKPPVMLEVRAKMPRGRGGFPAIWLLDGRLTGGNQEIDVVEYISQSHDGSDWETPSLYGTSTWETIYHAYHDGRGGSVETYTNSKADETLEWCGLPVDFTREFHTYGLKYTQNEVVWYIDGVVVNRIFPQKGGSGEGIKVRRFPTAAMNVTLNLAMDPAWFASTSRENCCVTDATTQDHFFNPGGNEVNMAIDFVRVSKP